MSRSQWKVFFINNYIICLINKHFSNNKVINPFIKVWSRDSIISSKCLGWSIYIHKGNGFVPLVITENMIGHKFGEFAFTRSYYLHPNNQSVKNKKKIKKK